MMKNARRWYRRIVRRLPALPTRFHIAFGLLSVVVSIILLGVYLGFVPDKATAVHKGRVALAETVAASSSLLLDTNRISDVRANIEFVLERNESLQSIELRRESDDSVAVLGSVGQVLNPQRITVPLYRNKRKWGELVLVFGDVGTRNLMQKWRASPFAILIFTGLLCAPAFYFYLGRMLKELNPSAAVPGRVRSALDSLAEALIVVDSNENIVLANLAFAKLNGIDQDQLLGINVQSLDWMIDEDSDGSYPWVKSIEDAASVRNAMIGYQDCDERTRKFQMSCSPVTGARGRVGGVLISMDDVTELEEKELLLRQSMQEAEQANEAKSQFISNISHEIRTPMTAILGFTDVLRGSLQMSPADQQKHLQTISNSGRHLLELINDVLDLSKVESGAMDMENIETKVPQLVSEVIKVLKVKAIEKDIGLSMTLADEFPLHIWSDPSRLRQIITNLVGNAIKFTEKGEVSIAVRWQPDNRQVHIAVSDSGIGMSETQVATIFEAFTQADASITRRFGGTGLGLSISKKLAQALGGDISVSSIAGSGSTFTVVIPTGNIDDVAVRSSEEILASLDVIEDDSHVEWSFPESLVLVVDDAAENRELLSIVLSSLELNVITAANGKLAVEQTQQHDFDVILMDIQMPVMGGYEAVALMRENGLRQPIVALTANAMKGYEKKILGSGFSHYQTKPINLEKLTTLLARLLGGQPRTTSCSHNVVNELMAESTPPEVANQKSAALQKNQLPVDDTDSHENSNTRLAVTGQSSLAASESHQKPSSKEPIPSRRAGAVGNAQPSATIGETTPMPEQPTTPIYSKLTEANPKLSSIVDRFLEKLGTQIKAMQDACDAGEWVILQELAHWLKGSGGTVGFDQVYDPAKHLETAATNHDKGLCDTYLREIHQLSLRFKSVPPDDGQSEALLAAEKSITESDAQLSNCQQVVDNPIISKKLNASPGLQPAVDKFIDLLENRLALLEPAIAGGDKRTIVEMMQWIKNAGGSVGFDELTKLAEALEHSAWEDADMQQQAESILLHARRIYAGRNFTPVIDKSA